MVIDCAFRPLIVADLTKRRLVGIRLADMK
jgi:hypothetical protein